MKPSYITLLKSSDYAKKKLSKCHTGQIHSVYRKTVNILTDQGLLALQSDHSPLSPISLITALSESEIQLLPISKGDRIHFSENSLEIESAKNTYIFSYEKAAIYNLKISAPLSHAESPVLIDRLEKVISNCSSGGFDMIFSHQQEKELPIMFTVAKNRIDTSLQLLSINNPTDAARELVRLLGLGIGLTPSGDDFLCGVLAGLTLAEQENSLFCRTLKEEISTHLGDTIDISASFLACALENQYSLAVNSLSSLPSADEIQTLFSEIGHSSGTDTLCGILYALRLHR
ncbi:DUF2877 domain-containing protein [Faecalicatena contorta]|uniref:DUF2877 domain-containing protein n=1 Tax=Faecalicatena contorta TaxID=39482 RepID=UPI001F331F30|nr:DUF2877 domain-containing protein [Faecalicatena contorta]MCF2680855.1 DUF2877 domain-containing protein [Faecalicatena contorta]